MGFTALLSLMLLLPLIGYHVPWGLIVSILIGGVALAIAALLVPVQGVHHRIAEAKRAELARIRSAVRRASRARLEGLEGPDDPQRGEGQEPGDASLSDLLLYEQRIVSVSTWPFDVPTLLRFGLYVALGLGSWLGAAVVERWFGALLDS